jgi:hypothetical protein
MAILRERIRQVTNTSPGLTDREAADRLLGSIAQQQAVNQTARAMAVRGEIQRRIRQDGKIGNFSVSGRHSSQHYSRAGVAMQIRYLRTRSRGVSKPG